MAIMFRLMMTFLAGSCAFLVQAETLLDAYELNTLAQPLNRPWAVVALPDNRFLVTEMHGTLAVIDENKAIVRHDAPIPDLYAKSQGGFLDLALLPDFEESGRVLISYSTGTDDANRLAVALARFENEKLGSIWPVFMVNDTKDTPVHFGGRLAAMGDGSWLVTSGEGFDYREQAQVKTSQMGKVLRFTPQGNPVDNPPFPDTPYLYSLGHRNPQGLVVDGETDTIYELEHGPAGGDEINVLKPGNNYGWPVITQGLDYSGAKITPYTEYPGMEQPLVNWTPSIAPSSMALYRGAMFPKLNGMMLVTTLKDKALYAVNLQTGETIHIVPELNDRLRDVIVDEDGSIIVLTDKNNARLVRISSKRASNPQ